MKNIIRFLVLLSPILLFSNISLGGETGIPMGIYEYVYEHNTKSLNENHYMELSGKKGEIAGQYYGTSDDFDDAREGYLPGFFVAEMNNLMIEGDTITFEVKPGRFFNNAITPMKRNCKNSTWNIIHGYEKRIYHGKYHDGKIIIQSDGMDNRVFVKMK